MKKHSMKHLTAAAAAVALALLAAFPAWAASSTKKITAITLEIEADIEPGTDFGEESIEFDASGDKFYVGDYEVKNDGQAWEEDTVPKLEVTLEANDDYRFSTSIRKDKIRLKGVGAVCKGAARKEAGQQLVLTIELDSLTKSLRPIENVRLNPDGVVSWNPVSTAGSYEFRVYRDGKSVGSAITTTYNSYNCSEKLTKSANYYVKVRAINKVDSSIIGEWAESNTMNVDANMASYFKDNPVEDPEGVYPYSSWKQAEDGRWWYDNGDGTYPSSNWQEIGGKWYFFDAEGYMVTGWIDWEGKRYFCNESGEMLKDCITEDNYRLGEDGAVISQDPAPGP